MKNWGNRGVAVLAVATAVVACGSAPKKPSDFHPTATQQTSFLSIERDAGGFEGQHASDTDLVGLAKDACSFMSHESYEKSSATISGDFSKFGVPHKPVDVQTLIFAAVKQICPQYDKKLPAP